MPTSGHHISAEPSAAEMAAMEALAASGSCPVPEICSGENLIQNASCEQAGKPPPCWTQASGAWERQQGGVGGFPAARDGTYLFWAGNVAAGELYQEIDVSAEAVKIDAGSVRIRFSGWLNTWATDEDTSQVIVEFRKADGTVIESYDTGVQDVDTWTNFSDARIAPNLTRKIRVRLLAVRNSGTSNDGYFDGLSLTAECNVCGATVEFLDKDNNKIAPETKALNVSNYVTNNSLPASSAFAATSSDPDNFRLEVEDAGATGGSVSVTLKVANRSAITYTLDKKSGNKFRGEFLRLVTDSKDNEVQTTQTVLCKLAEQVVLSYTRAGETCKDTRKIDVGRPKSEDDNGNDQLKHDIRELKVNVVVFAKPGTTKLDGAINDAVTTIKVDSVATAQSAGTIKIESEVITYTDTNAGTNEFTGCTRGAEGTTAAAHADNTDVLYSTKTPALTKNQVDADLDTADERFAQTTIRIKRPASINMGGDGSPGKALPGAMLDGYKYQPSSITLANLTDDEKAVVNFKDSDSNSVDAFYVDGDLVNTDDATKKSRGIAYITGRNNTGDSKYQNFVVVASTRGTFTLGHEFMHILLNAVHRTGGNPDPTTALFYAPTSTNTVSGTKRIGPYPSDGPGDTDTFDIRSNAEDLP